MKKNQNKFLEKPFKKVPSISMIVFYLLLSNIILAGQNNAINKLLNLNMKDVSLEQGLAAIEEQSEFHFFYNTKEVNTDQKVNIAAKDLNINDVLKDLCDQTNLKYEIIDKQIVLTPLQKSKQDLAPNKSKRIVKGVVTDTDEGMAIPGVTIRIKGTGLGTTTNINGFYTLEIPEDGTVLVFSFIGMQEQQITVVNQTIIDIALESAIYSLAEVVAIGYGTQITTDLTGSIAKVNTDKLIETPVQSFESAMVGKTPGVFIEQSSGRLGSAMSIRIRGASSISASNQPLYVIDGVPMSGISFGNEDNLPTNPMTAINLNDIESIQILKDASAAAIYGSRASNGVVLVTTKKGKSGKTQFNIDVSNGWSSPSHKLDFLDNNQYMELINEAFDNVADANGLLWGGDKEYWFDAKMNGWREGKYYDWQEKTYQKSFSRNINLSASGGNDNVSYYSGLSYTNQDGLLIENHYDKFSGKLNIDVNASEKFKFGFNSSFSISNLDRLPNEDSFGNPIMQIGEPPVTPFYNEDGSPNQNTCYYNALRSVGEAYEKTTSTNLFSNFYADYAILDNLKFRSEVGFSILNQEERNYWGAVTNVGAPAGRVLNRDVRIKSYNLNNYFTYDLKLKTQYKINIIAGMSFQETDNEFFSVGAKNMPNDDFNILSAASEILSYSGYGETYNYISYFSRGNFKFKNKYLLSVSGRVDGSSRFGANNRYAFFPAASLGWILSHEDFLKGSSIVSFLKVRTSYGLTGNSEIANFASRGLNQVINYSGGSGIIPTTLENPNLKWETTAQWDIGIDFAFLNNRVSGAIDYYYKKTTDLLLNKTLMATSGFLSILENVGEMENKGLEFSLNTINTIGALKWTTNFNISFNKNKVLTVNGSDIISSWPSVNRVREGEELGVFIMKEYAGVDPNNGDALYYINADTRETTNDFNKAEFQVLGSPNPDFIGGLTNNFKYKNFELNLLFSFVYGNEIYNGSGTYSSNNFSVWFGNQTVDQMERWQQPGDITDVPQARLALNNGSGTSSRWLEDGSYLRLKNLTFAYNFPSETLKRLKIRSLRVYMSAQNLLTFTKYPGWDPEALFVANRNATNTNLIRGVTYYTTPQARTIMIGFNLGF